MIDRRCLYLAILVCGASRAALGQTARSDEPIVLELAEVYGITRFSDPYLPLYLSEYRSPTRLNAQPVPFDPDARYGFRNPGGIGRVREFYPPGNVFERGDDRVRTARFDDGPTATSRQYQMMAQRVGNDRTRTMNAQISAFGRPLNFGFGYGFGGYGLGGYGYGSRFPY